MTNPSVQDGIDRAGSPVKLLWRSEPPQPWRPPVLPDEFVDWRVEQTASFETASLSNLSHHMQDLFIEGPDATRLLSEYSANNYENFAVEQAKQFVPVTERGHIISDGILFRRAENSYILSGIPPAQAWIKYQGEHGAFRVEFSVDPSSDHRGGGDPVLFRYQIQGPNAMEIIERAFDAPLPETKFFHATNVSLGGRHFRALRHGMSGQPGYEFLGEYADGEFVRDALMKAGDGLGLIEVGALAYGNNAVESGWVAAPTVGIYTDPDLRPYRESLSLFTWEGQWPHFGSLYSPNIEDYYLSPYELGYGRSIAFNHDFLGRDALERAHRDGVARTKVSLELHSDGVREVFGADPGYMQDNGFYRLEVDGKLVGVGVHGVNVPRLDLVLWLGLIGNDYAVPGTEVELVYGRHPGPGTDPDADLGFPRLRATVQPAPYNSFARTGYRDRAARA